MKNAGEFKHLIKMIWVIIVGLLVIGVILMFFQRQIGAITEEISGEVTQYEKYYVIIADESDSILWESIYESAITTGKEEVNAYVEFIEVGTGLGFTLQEKLRIAIDSNVDGIIISSDNEEETTELIDEAVEKGIAVVTVLNDATETIRQSYVGVNNYSLGEAYGVIAWDYISTEKVEQEECTISILMDSSSVDTGKNTIYLGLKEYLDNQIKESEWQYAVTIEAVSVNREETFVAEETIGNILNSNNTDIMICLNAVDTETAYRMAVDYNQVGNVEIFGYYESEVILEAISKNIIHSTISINGEEVGRQCVLALNEYQETGYVNGYFPVEIQVINSTNVDQQLEKYEDVSEVENE